MNGEQSVLHDAAVLAFKRYTRARDSYELATMLEQPEVQAILNKLYRDWIQASERESMSYRVEWSER